MKTEKIEIKLSVIEDYGVAMSRKVNKPLLIICVFK